MTPGELEIVRLAVAGRGVELARQIAPRTEERTFALLREHHLPGFAHEQLRRRGELHALPEALVKQLEAFAAKQRKNGRRHIDHIAALRAQLDAAHIDVLFLKGPFLSQLLYDDPLARLYWDVDILLDGCARLPRVDGVLQRHGWERRSSLALGLPLVSHFTHNAEYAKRDERGAKLDVHWALGTHLSLHLDEARLWAEREHATLAGSTYPVPSREHVLVALILGLLNDVQRGRARLKSLLDLSRTLERFDQGLRWPDFFAAREREGMLTVALAMCEMALRAFPLDRAPVALRAALSHHRAERLVPSDITPLLGLSERSIAHKRWTFGLYRGGRILASLWWAASLPIKHTVFRDDHARRRHDRERSRA